MGAIKMNVKLKIEIMKLTEKEKDTFSMALHALDREQSKLLKKGFIDKKYFTQVVEVMKSLNNKILKRKEVSHG